MLLHLFPLPIARLLMKAEQMLVLLIPLPPPDYEISITDAPTPLPDRGMEDN